MTDGDAIRAAREKRGWSQAKLASEAARLGGTPVQQQVVTRIEAGGESKHKMAVLRALDLLPKPQSTAAALPPSDVEPDDDAPAFRGLGGPRNVPEIGIAVGGDDGDFDLNGEVIDYLPRPAALARRDVFAVRVKNHSMEPRFREGHVLYVDRKRQPSPGDDAVIELHPAEGHRAGRAFIKELVSKGMATVVVRQFNPPKEITYPRDQVKAIYRVVPNNELFGV